MQIGLFSTGMATSVREGKLWIHIDLKIDLVSNPQGYLNLVLIKVINEGWPVRVKFTLEIIICEISLVAISFCWNLKISDKNCQLNIENEKQKIIK